MENKDFKILNETIKKMETQIDALKYYFFHMQSGDKDFKLKEKNFKLAEMVVADMDKIFDTKIKDFQKKMLQHISEETKNENFSAMSKINSPDAKSLQRMGKILNVKSAFINKCIKTASEKRLKKEGILNGLRQISKSERK